MAKFKSPDKLVVYLTGRSFGRGVRLSPVSTITQSSIRTYSPYAILDPGFPYDPKKLYLRFQLTELWLL